MPIATPRYCAIVIAPIAINTIAVIAGFTSTSNAIAAPRWLTIAIAAIRIAQITVIAALIPR